MVFPISKKRWIIIIICVAGVHPGHSAGRDSRHRAGGAGAADAVEDGHHHTRPAGVRALREGAHDGQVGHGENCSLHICTRLVLQETPVPSCAVRCIEM